MADRAVPIIIQLVVFYLVISWFVRLVRRRGQPPTDKKPAGGTPRPSPGASLPRRPESAGRPGQVERKDLLFNGVRWQVTLRPHRELTPGARVVRRDVYVEEPPRCPKCGLGVVEEKSWLGYTWSCPECGLKKNSGRNMHDVAESLSRMLR